MLTTVARVSSLSNVPVLALMGLQEHGYRKLWAKHDWLRPGLWRDGRTAAQKRWHFSSIERIKWRSFLCNFHTYCARSERKWEGQGQRQGQRRKRKRKEGRQRDAQRTALSGFEGFRNELLIDFSDQRDDLFNWFQLCFVTRDAAVTDWSHLPMPGVARCIMVYSIVFTCSCLVWQMLFFWLILRLTRRCAKWINMGRLDPIARSSSQIFCMKTTLFCQKVEEVAKEVESLPWS